MKKWIWIVLSAIALAAIILVPVIGNKEIKGLSKATDLPFQTNLKGWIWETKAGIDFTTGILHNRRDTYYWGYGPMMAEITSEPMQNDKDPGDYLLAEQRCGDENRIYLKEKSKRGLNGMSIHCLGNTLTIQSGNIHPDSDPMQVFRSIRFTPNAGMVCPEPEFTLSLSHSGKMLFVSECQPCHALGKKIEGPALTDLLKDKDSAWFHHFLKNRKALRTSEESLLKQKEWGLNCPEKPKMDDGDLDRLWTYLQSKRPR